MKYLVSQVESWREEIAALPPPDPGRRRVGKHQAVTMMAKELQAAARLGYTAEELLEVLAARGLNVHEDTLRDALKKAKRTLGAGSPRGRRRSGGSPGSPTESFAERVAAGGVTGVDVEAETTATGNRSAEAGVQPPPGPSGGARAEVREEDSGSEKPSRASGSSDSDVGVRAGGEAPRADGEVGPSGDGARGGSEELAEHPGACGPGMVGRAPDAAVGSQPRNGQRFGGKVNETGKAGPAPPRGTFTPRSDSEDI